MVDHHYINIKNKNMGGKPKPPLHLHRKRRGLLICDVSTLLGHKNSQRMERIEKGKHPISVDEAFEIAHILDIDIEEIRLKKQEQVESEIKSRAITHAKTFAGKADQSRFKKRLLWLTHLILGNKNKKNT